MRRKGGRTRNTNGGVPALMEKKTESTGKDDLFRGLELPIL